MKPVFSSQAVLQKQSYDDLSVEEQALKVALEKLQSLQSVGNNNNDAPNQVLLKKESLEEVRQCFEALEYWEDSLAVEQQLEMFADSALELAACIFRQGKLLVRVNDLSQASTKYQKALEMFQIEHDNGTIYHADIGNIMVAMAGVDFAREDIDKCLSTLDASEDHFRHHGQSIAEECKSLNEPHPDVVKCLENQGMMYRLKQDFFQALGKFEEALEVVKETEIEKRQALQMHVADMLGASGDLDGAIVYYEKIRSEDRAQRVDGEETALDGVILHCLGVLHSQQRQLELAKEELSRAVEIKRKVGGETNPEVSSSLVVLGSVHGVMGNKRDALECFQQALFIAKASTENENDPEVLHILRNIAILKGEKVSKWDG